MPREAARSASKFPDRGDGRAGPRAPRRQSTAGGLDRCLGEAPARPGGSLLATLELLFGVQTFYSLVDIPPSEAADAAKPNLSVTQGHIEFAGVDFAYRAGVPVLRGVTFVAEPGQVTALVGPSGGGKSTVLSLILRLYEVDAGEITLDGQNVASVSPASLRRQIAYVGQDVFLFRGTIRENIGFGRPNATEQEIIAAATAAHAHEFIMTFPNGYDTPVGEHGMQLSTGQRQRVSIARALLKDAP